MELDHHVKVWILVSGELAWFMKITGIIQILLEWSNSDVRLLNLDRSVIFYAATTVYVSVLPEDV